MFMHVHAVGVLRVHRDAPKYQPRCQMRLSPRDLRQFAPASSERYRPPGVAVDDRIDARAAAPARSRCRCARRAPESRCRAPGSSVLPPSVDLYRPLPGPVRGRIDVPRRAPRLPQRGVDRRCGLPGSNARSIAPVSSSLPSTLLPVRAAVASNGTRRVRRSVRRDARARRRTRCSRSRGSTRIWPICWLSRQADVRPVSCRRRPIGTCRRPARCPNACPLRRCRRRSPSGRMARRAIAPIDPTGCVIEDRLPGAAGIARVPHAAVDRAEIEVLRLVPARPRRRARARRGTARPSASAGPGIMMDRPAAAEAAAAMKSGREKINLVGKRTFGALLAVPEFAPA